MNKFIAMNMNETRNTNVYTKVKAFSKHFGISRITSLLSRKQQNCFTKTFSFEIEQKTQDN